MKKAQLTLFMLLGIVLLIVFGFLFYSTGIIAKYQLNKRVNRITEELLKTTAFEYYVTVCLDDSAKKGLNLVGRQGGVIYEDQGGWSKETKFIPFEVYNTTYNVTYALTNPVFDNNFHPPPPEYPYEDFNYGLPWYSPRENYFGINKLLYLCDINGPNKRDIYQFAELTCEQNLFLTTYNTPRTTSIQEQLAIYIANKTKDCVNFSSFKSKFGYDITKGENVSAEIIYGDEDVIVNLKYPLDIKLGRSSKITKFLNFKTKVDVRFKSIYNLASAIIEGEIRNINFRAEEDYITSRDCKTHTQYLCWKKGMEVREFEDVCKSTGLCSEYDDIIQIIDNKSLVTGKPFVFQFGVKNRYPALHKVKTFHGDEYDIIVIEDQLIELNPIGLDPDEDNITYNYSGWKEDYDHVFDFTGFSAGNCNWKTCVQTISDQPHNWTNSTEFRLTNQNATYKAQHSDTGVHNVTIFIYDEEGLRDWQNITILVNDQPVIQLEGYNNYFPSGDKHFWASIEDPYFLDASGTTVIFSDEVTYRWNDEIHKEFNFNTTDPLTHLPDRSPDIDTITLRNFTIQGTHTVSLTVTDGFSVASGQAKKEMDVEVKYCLPYVNANVNPYPYNTYGIVTTLNSFQADHTCCTTDGNYEPRTKKCFEEAYYTCMPTRRDKYIPAERAKIEIADGELVVAEIAHIDFGTFPPPGDANDIYLRNYTQTCSGTRGNACSGKITDRYDLKQPQCTNKGPGEEETCQGPCNPDKPGCNKIQCPGLNIADAPPGCHKYQARQSFEKNFSNTPGATGICNTGWECSHTGMGNYKSGGDFLAQAYCGGGECKNVLPGEAVDCTYFDGRQILNLGSTPNNYERGDIICTYNNNIASVTYGCSNGGCEPINLDLDDEEDMCNDCHRRPGSLNWTVAGEQNVGDYPDIGISGCCGDDSGERYQFYKDDNNFRNKNDDACCNNVRDCVFAHECYNDGETRHVSGSPALDKCVWGTWRITP